MRKVIVTEWMSLDGGRAGDRLVESQVTTTGAIMATYSPAEG